jgi:iron complex outermembrane receptor protein
MRQDAYRWVISGFALFAMFALAGVQPACAQAKEFNVPAQSATTGIPEFARQAGIQILVAEPLVRGKRTAGVTGTHAVPDGLAILLRGSGLVATSRDGTTYTVAAASSEPTSSTGGGSTGAYLASAAGGPAGSPAIPAEDDRARLADVVVTAQRREQSVQAVPVSMQVLTGAELERTGASGFEDYLNSVSSVGFTKSGNGAVQIGIRGISNVDGSDYGIATSKSAVGVYLNDVPIQGSGPIPDLLLYDLARVEVLKGPQGTLYGEGAMGGAIKMVLNAADPSAFGGKADVALSNTSHGGTNYDVRGAINVPLVADRAALRLSATGRDDSGFINNIVTGQNHVGEQKTSSVRLLLDARLTERFTSELMLFHQHLNLDGFPEQLVGLGDLQSNFPDHQYNTQNFDLFSLMLKYHFDGADLSSATAYTRNGRDFYQRNPFVGYIDGFALTDFGLAGIPNTDPQGFTARINEKAVTEELRLSSNGEQRLGWTVGAYFRTAKQHAESDDTLGNFAAYNASMQAAAADPASMFSTTLASVNGTLSQALFAGPAVYQDIVDEQTKQYAIFGELDFKLTPQLSLKLGLRAFKEHLDINQFNQALNLEALDFALYGSPASSSSTDSVDDHGLVPRAGLSYAFSKDALVYALASKGFRSGGPNFNDGHASVPSQYQPDSLWNYEAGFKSVWLDHRLIFNGAVYYIDWKDIQVPATDPVALVGYVANAGTARVTGGELQVQLLPSIAWRLGANLGLLNSKLTSLGPTVTGATVGSELPFAPKVTASAFVQYSHPVGTLGTGVARFDYDYVGRQAVQLITPTIPLDLYYKDAYRTGRIQAGLESDRWSVYLYVDNLWDERGVVQKNEYPPLYSDVTLALIRPRTVGLRVGTNF